jgi:hypothetical protein
MNASRSNDGQTSRIDRELIELLNELRVALPGVQVLFAFLLTVPFSQRFGSTTDFQRGIFFTTLLLTAISAALLIAPSAYHRLHFRQKDKEQLLLTSNNLAIAGIGFLAGAMIGALVLITDLLYGPVATIICGIVAAGVFGWFWAAFPLLRRGSS